MIDSSANNEISRVAKSQANSIANGGFEKMLNDMESYGVSAVSSAVSFGVSHIPVVGPTIAFGLEKAATAGMSAARRKALENASTKEERTKHALFLLELGLAGDLRKLANTIASVNDRASLFTDPQDCQEAFRLAYRDHLAINCMDELDDGVALLEQLAKDLKAIAQELRARAAARVNNHRFEYDVFRDNHKTGKCMGTQRCYWTQGPGTPFSAITKDML